MRDNNDIKSISEAYVSMLTEAKGNYYEIGGDSNDGGTVLNVYVRPCRGYITSMGTFRYGILTSMRLKSIFDFLSKL